MSLLGECELRCYHDACNLSRKTFSNSLRALKVFAWLDYV